MSEVSNPPVTAPAKQNVFRLIYRSHSKIPPDKNQEEFGQILRRSRINNASSGVTGALLMYDNWFAQVLEGPEPAVRALYGRIKADPRHDTLDVREEHAVAGRAFSRWAMANVGEHGDADIPMVATATGVVDGGAWRTATPEQEKVLVVLRDLTRGYGRGA